jgi:hypothetical protein
MPLASDLIDKGAEKLLNLQANAGDQDTVRAMYWDLVAMKPKGLTALQWNSIDLMDFADVFDAHRAELRPWVTVYAAAFGLMGPWITVLNLWCRRPIPAATDLDQRVKEALDGLFTGYTNLVAL